MGILYTARTKRPKIVYTRNENKDKNGSVFNLNENLLLLLRIIASMNKIFLIYKKFYTPSIWGVFFSQKDKSFSFYLKIKYDLKNSIFYFTKHIHIIKSIYQFLDFFQYSILNSEIKIGKIKKFICLFLKSKELQTNCKNVENQQTLYFSKNFLKKEPLFGNLTKVINKKFKKIAPVKIKITIYLKKKINKLLSIRKKLLILKEMFFILFEKFKKFFFYCPCNFFKLQSKKRHDPKIKKEGILNGNFSKKCLVPASIKIKKFILMTKVSKRLNLKILFQSQPFRARFNRISKFFLKFEKSKTLRNLNLRYTFPIYNSYIEIPEFLKLKKHLMRSEIINKDSKFQNLLKKKKKDFIKSFFIYRLWDVSTESSFLWEYNRSETKSNLTGVFETHTKSFNKCAFLKEKLFIDNRIKILILSLFQRIRILTFEINKEILKERDLFRKFHEVKGMELDFQVFTNIIKNLNKIKKI